MLLGEIRRLSGGRHSGTDATTADHGSVRRAHALNIPVRIQQMLPVEVEFVHGPGCPVCVLPMGRVDDCVALAERPEVIFITFGDAMRVPDHAKAC